MKSKPFAIALVKPHLASLARWEAFGILFISILGSLLHFLFDWSGNWKPLALIAAANESAWEHFKLAFWPGLLWALIEWRRLAALPPHFWPSKGVALLAPPVTILCIISAYKSFSERNILILDIATFYIGVALGQFVSYLLIKSTCVGKSFHRFGWLLMGAQTVAYLLFTFFPPKLDVFIDPRNGNLGIP